MAEKQAADLQEKTVVFLEKAGGAIKRSQILVDRINAEQLSAQKTASDLAKELVGAGLIQPHMEKLAVTKLASHGSALEIVRELIDVSKQQRTMFEQKQAAAGGGEPGSAAGPAANGRTTNVIDARMRRPGGGPADRSQYGSSRPGTRSRF